MKGVEINYSNFRKLCVLYVIYLQADDFPRKVLLQDVKIGIFPLVVGDKIKWGADFIINNEVEGLSRYLLEKGAEEQWPSTQNEAIGQLFDYLCFYVSEDDVIVYEAMNQ